VQTVLISISALSPKSFFRRASFSVSIFETGVISFSLSGISDAFSRLFLKGFITFITFIGIALFLLNIPHFKAKHINGDLMLISLLRAVVIYVLILAVMRILGKRQIGDLQPSELVITILLSEFFAIPMQDTKIPLLETIVPVFLLTGLEIVSSVISVKSVKFRKLIDGNSILVINNGSLDQKQLKKLRYTVDDLLEALRKKDVFDISTVQYAIIETDGTLSVCLKAKESTVKNKNLNITTAENTLPVVVVSDGRLIKENMKIIGCDEKQLASVIKKENTKAEDIFIMLMDINKKPVIIKRDSSI
jgi:uncharacterized membrane protein YcaP (DUF421 family)